MIDLCEEDQLQKALLASRETSTEVNARKSIEEDSGDEDEEDTKGNNLNGNVEPFNGNSNDNSEPPDITSEFMFFAHF